MLPGTYACQLVASSILTPLLLLKTVENTRVNIELKEVLRENNNNNNNKNPNTHFRKLGTGLADIPSTRKNDTTKQ